MTQRAALYCRISNDDKADDKPDAKGVSRQEREARAHVKRKGYKVAGLYVDNDLGASRHSRAKVRPEWERLLADVRAGRIDVVVARDLDRLTRRVREGQDLIDLVEQTGVTFDLYRGHIDLTNASGQQMFGIMVNIAAGESARTSERMKSQRRDAAMRGEPVRGVDGFGWRDGKPLPREAKAIKAAADAIIAGSTLAAIARDWNAQGLPRRKSSRPWWGPQVAVVMRNPRHAGRVVYRGESVGLSGETPIIDEGTFDTMLAVLNSPSRKRAPRRRRMLSGLVRCGKCEATLRRGAGGTPPRPMWTCVKDHGGGCGGLGIMAVPVEAEVERAVIDALEASTYRKPTAHIDPAIATELARIDADATDLGTAFGRGDIPMPAFAAASKELERRRDDLLAATRPERADSVLSGITPKTIRAEWPSMDEDNKRLIIAAVIDHITIRPLSETSDKRNPIARVDVAWRA
jgi:DNA invertase Pin-like site-specific DNA recombinase